MYIIGEKYYAAYTRGWQCYAELIKFIPAALPEEPDKVLMYNERHGYFVTTVQDLDNKN